MTSRSYSFPEVSLHRIRKIQAQLRNEAIRFVSGNLLVGPIRRTRHFREWFRKPMNYARIMELPLTFLMLDAARHDKILDVSSPKLLALYYALKGYDQIVTGDLEDYFVTDFRAYKRHAGLAIETNVFDAAKEIPYPDEHFDTIFSVSVLEHIPDNGDTLALREMLRVLRPSGSIVITLPAFPHYVEEWVSARPYWKTVQDDHGKTFFQRRYDESTLLRKFTVPGGTVTQVILIAEKPIEPPRIGENGKMLHNSYLINRVPAARLLNSRLVRYVPFAGYAADAIVSQKCHYLTKDWSDPNIRQVALKITKTLSSEPRGSEPAP